MQTSYLYLSKNKALYMHKINTEKLFTWLLFSLTIIISLVPFFRIGLTTADDLDNYMEYLGHGLFKEAWMYAKYAGRFYFIITKPLYSLPYIGDSFLITKVIQSFSLLLSYSLFSILIKKIFKSKELALALFLLLIMATPVSQNFFLPFIAYPFYFTFSFSILICSLLLFLKYTETNYYKYIIFSAIVLFIAILFYETYLVFLLFICFFIVFRNLYSLGSFQKLFSNKIFYKELIPIISVAVLYLLLYFGFRQIFLNEDELYIGSSFVKSFSFANYLTLILKLTKTILPTKLYYLSQDLIVQNSLSPSGHLNNFWYILQNSKLLSIVNTIIQMFLFVFIALRFDKKITYKRVIIGILVAFLFAISAHSILGIAEKYNAVEYAYIRGYVTSYYSYFGVWLIILLLSYLIIKLTHKIKYIKYGIIVVLGLGIGYVSIITSYTNEHLSRGWEKSKLRNALLDNLLEDGAFNKVDNGSILYSPEMHGSDPLGGFLLAHDFTWAEYIKIKYERDFYFAKNPNNLEFLINQYPEAKVYRFTKKHTQKNTNFMFVLAEINKSTIDFDKGIDLFMNATCNKADIYYYSATKDFTFIFRTKDSENKSAKVNDGGSIKLISGFNQVRINSIDKNDKICSFTIESEAEMFSEMFSIANMTSSCTNIICVVDNNRVLANFSNDIENPIFVDSTNAYPIEFIPEISLEPGYSTISLSAKLEIINHQKDKDITIVVEIRDSKGKNVFWQGYAYQNISIINFVQTIDLKGLKRHHSTSLKFYIWNSGKGEFTVNRISNISVKII